MTEATLHFVHGASPPDSDPRVFDALTREFLGAPFTFRVIGSSHYVSAPAYDFHELSSCDPVGGDAVTTLALDGPRLPTAGTDAATDGGDPEGRLRLAYAADGLRCETLVERRPLAAFPADGSFDLAYWFGDEAVTTVDVGETGYETYHTYPEFDLALYTRTRFRSVPGGAAVGPGAGPAPDAADRLTD
jgi:hypothetical protein